MLGAQHHRPTRGIRQLWVTLSCVSSPRSRYASRPGRRRLAPGTPSACGRTNLRSIRCSSSEGAPLRASALTRSQRFVRRQRLRLVLNERMPVNTEGPRREPPRKCRWLPESVVEECSRFGQCGPACTRQATGDSTSSQSISRLACSTSALVLESSANCRTSPGPSTRNASAKTLSFSRHRLTTPLAMATSAYSPSS